MSTPVTTEQLDQKLNEFEVKLFKYLDDKFKNVDEQFVVLEKNISKLTSTIGGFVKRLDDIEIENTARDAQLARLERWIEQIASKSGIKLEY